MPIAEKLEPVLEGYKSYFPNHWEDEKYKWEAVHCFQDNWDIDAPSFGEMFEKATKLAENLLASSHFIPRKMILDFSRANDQAVREMFDRLYDESQDLQLRVDRFMSSAEEMREKYDDGTWKNHYQNTNAVSTYLWLRFPDRYYIYKYSVYKDVAAELDDTYRPKANGSVESMINGFSFYDEICAAVQKNREICTMVSETVKSAGSCWLDSSFHTTTIDIGFYLSKFYLDEKKKKQEEDSWFPTDYTPELSEDDWVDLLADRSVFTPRALQIVKRFKDFGGQATCTQLSLEYGEVKNFYNSGSVSLARRIAKKTGCPVMRRDTGKERLWAILYTGKQADADTDGSYIWRLRDELSAALERVDLSEVPLYANGRPSIWKISHGSISAEHRATFEARQVAVVHGLTHPKGVSKLSQGTAFTDVIRKGDFFYLCYGNSIRLLGQFTSDDATLNPEKQDDWYERPYQVIALSKDTSPYAGTQKWWTPNDNSTCIRVSEDEEGLFENLILQPYFGLTVAELYGDSDQSHSYWWMTVNPDIWSFADAEIGEEQDYSLYNSDGHQRHIFQNFLNVKPGDRIIGYESGSVKKITATGKITQSNDGQYIYFEKTENLPVPIDYSDLKGCPELEEMEFFVQPNGSLFKLTEEEYNFLVNTIREENPLSAPTACFEKYTKEDFLKEVFMAAERYDMLKALLLTKMNVILQGAPGVGKTFLAEKLAYSIMGEKDDSKIEFVQFHQNYSYEDFIMGFRPDGAEFKLTEGIFVRFCQMAEQNPEKKYFFIIDEINRGNMSKIFGELLMLIEKDYRKRSVALAYTGRPFSVPENLYIIGMMNTADRSLAVIDYALRRRFSFFDINPGFTSDGFRKYQAGLASETFDALIEQIKALNRAIRDDKSLGKGFMIGHSYFCGRKPDDCTVDWMQSVVEFDIIPMLEEYWFDDPEQLRRWERNLHGVFNDV